jgi:predicted CXXCH cytochrome family protein
MTAALALLAALASAAGSSISLTRHNLSVSGPGTIKAQSETQICIFCHVPHRGLSLGVNRPPSTATYQPYASSTLAAPAPGVPSGASKVCLSCHDGTIALGLTVASGKIAMTNAGPGEVIPAGPSNLGTDLRGSHPVSFTPVATAQIFPPPALDPVRLDALGRLQCTSCHDPHRDDLDPVQGSFLVKQNRAAALCQTCHAKAYWASNPSTHQSSTALFDTAHGAATGYTTVADNACESCHASHAAAAPTRLLRQAGAPLCLRCHDGTVARTNLGPEFAKPYAHPVLTSSYAVHDEAEGPGNPLYRLPEVVSTAPRHVLCVDCHNPHATFPQPAAAPRANGFLSGAWGIGAGGARVDPLQNEYELCLKCHGDSANQPQVRGPTPPETLRRAVTDVNLRRVFDLSSPSFHPVEGPGRGADVPSLVPPLTTASIVYCGDCHASDTGPGAGGTSPRGPHGSIYAHLLERNYSTLDDTPESPAAYALCYKCHDRTKLLDPAQSAFGRHATHVQADAAPCSACHASHGVSALQGNLVNNAHLVDFDVSIVSPNSLGVRQYTSTGPRTGTCSLSCHGVDHQASAYLKALLAPAPAALRGSVVKGARTR